MIVEELVAKIGLETEEFKEKIKEIKKEIHEMTENLGKAALGIGGLFVAASGALDALVVSTAEEVHHLENFGEAIGVSVRTMQAMGVAAGFAGESLETVQMGLRFLADATVQASRGNKTVQEDFDKLGLSVTDANGKLKTVEELLPDLAEAFERVEDPSRRVAIAQDLFGRGGLATLKAIQQIPGPLSEFTDGLEASGRVMSEETIKRMVGVAKTFNAIGGSLKGLKNIIATAALPYTEKFLNTLKKGLDDLAPSFRSFAQNLVDLINRPIVLIVETVQALAAAFLSVTEPFADARNVFLGLAAAAGLLGLAFAFPIVAILTLAGLLALLLEDIWAFVHGQNSALGEAVKAWADFKFQLDDIANDGGFLGFLARIVRALTAIIDLLVSLFSFDLSKISGRFAELSETVLPGNLGEFKAVRARDEANARALVNINEFRATHNLPSLNASPLSNEAINSIVGFNVQAPITVNAAPGMDEAALAKAVKNEMVFTVEEIRSTVGARK